MRRSTRRPATLAVAVLGGILALTSVAGGGPPIGWSPGPPDSVLVDALQHRAAARPPMPSSAIRTPAVAPGLAADALVPLDDAEIEARILRFGAERLGVPVEEVRLFALESFVVPGDSSRWVGGKVLHDATGGAVVVAARVASGEVVDGPSLEARIQAGYARQGKVDPAVEDQLQAASPTERLTVAVLVRGGSRAAAIASVRAKYWWANFSGDVPDTGDDALNLEIRSALRTAWREAARRAIEPVVARAEALGMTVEYAAAFAPIVYVTGTAEAIRQLADEPAVFRVMISSPTLRGR